LITSFHKKETQISSNYKVYQNRVYNINYLLEEDSFYNLQSTKNNLKNVSECIVDSLSRSHDKFFKNLSKRHINIKYKENYFIDNNFDNESVIEEYEEEDDFHRKYNQSTKVLNLYLPISLKKLKGNNSYFEKENLKIFGIFIEESCLD